ncbi:hypothetical protein CDAR_73371 [Caerostris darwini]|uniref:Uncharacterized protein n=1 Tax=Caerostris darwini TaxID=1538125 RepID=A0AAV4VLE3_9ARAC|nr:hypothetical protein CDAR_73371 [Caerostris darwini]
MQMQFREKNWRIARNAERPPHHCAKKRATLKNKDFRVHLGILGRSCVPNRWICAQASEVEEDGLKLIICFWNYCLFGYMKTSGQTSGPMVEWWCPFVLLIRLQI